MKSLINKKFTLGEISIMLIGFMLPATMAYTFGDLWGVVLLAPFTSYAVYTYYTNHMIRKEDD